MDTIKLLEGLSSEERLELLQRLLREEISSREEENDWPASPYYRHHHHHGGEHHHGPHGRHFGRHCRCCGC